MDFKLMRFTLAVPNWAFYLFWETGQSGLLVIQPSAFWARMWLRYEGEIDWHSWFRLNSNLAKTTFCQRYFIALFVVARRRTVTTRGFVHSNESLQCSCWCRSAGCGKLHRDEKEKYSPQNRLRSGTPGRAADDGSWLAPFVTFHIGHLPQNDAAVCSLARAQTDLEHVNVPGKSHNLLFIHTHIRTRSQPLPPSSTSTSRGTKIFLSP